MAPSKSMTGTAMIGFFAAMLVSTAAYPDRMGCSRSGAPGATIMGTTVTAGTDQAKFKRGSTVLACGATVKPCETLGTSWSTSGQYMVEGYGGVSAASGGKCNGVRADNSLVSWTMPSTGSGNVGVKITYASGYGSAVRQTAACDYTLDTSDTSACGPSRIQVKTCGSCTWYRDTNGTLNIEGPEDCGSTCTATELDFNSKSIQSIGRGAFNRTGLSHVTTLFLYYNQISSLEAGAFAGLGNLEELDLGGNQISSLEAGAFAGLGNLKTLFLFDNQISSLEPGAFAGLGNLVQLDLSGNNPLTCKVSLPPSLSSTSLPSGYDSFPNCNPSPTPPPTPSPTPAPSSTSLPPPWLADVAASGRFSHPSCNETRTMSALLEGLAQDPRLFVSGGMSRDKGSTGPFTWMCFSGHPCTEAVGSAETSSVGDDRMCYVMERRRDRSGGGGKRLVFHAWGLNSELGLCKSTGHAEGEGGGTGGASITLRNYTVNLARSCGLAGDRGCGTSAKGFTGWALGPDRAVDGNTNTWTSVQSGQAAWVDSPFSNAALANPWFSVDLGTTGNQVSHVVIKTASWIDHGGRWKANFPVSIHVGDSQDWGDNAPCASNVSGFGGPDSGGATLVSLNGSSSLEPVRLQERSFVYTGHPDLPASVIRFSCRSTGRWVHVVLNGTDFLTMGEVEVYGNRTASSQRINNSPGTNGCSRGTYRYNGVCVNCPRGWTTSTTSPLPANAGPEEWTGCSVACSPSMLSNSSTGCKGAWYKGASYPTSNSNARDCNAICSNAGGKACQKGGIEYAWGLERALQVIGILGETASCGVMNAVHRAYSSQDSDWSGLSKRTCGACYTGMCNYFSDGPHYDDASGNPAFYNSTETAGGTCTGGHGDMNKYCVCA